MSFILQPSSLIPFHNTLLQLWCERFVRGFKIGYGTKLACTLIGLLTSKHRGNTAVLLQTFYRVDVIRAGLFVGGVTSTVDTITAAAPKDLRRLQCATAVSALFILLCRARVRWSITMLLLVRALETGCQMWKRPRWMPDWLQENADVAVMCLSSAYVLPTWILAPHNLNGAYKHFLDVHGGRTLHIQSVLAERWRSEHIEPAHLLRHATTTCVIMHPFQSSCVLDKCEFMEAAVVRAMQLYAPLALATLLVFRRQALCTNPRTTLLHTLRSLARSCLFLSIYCTLSWTAICTLTRLTRYEGKYLPVMGGLIAGTSVLLESKSRRMELALYVLSQAIPSLYREMRGPIIPGSEVAIFGLSLYVLLYAQRFKNDCMRDNNRKLVEFLFQ